MVEAEARGDAKEPGPERRVAAKAVELLERASHRVLSQVRRVFGVCDQAH